MVNSLVEWYRPDGPVEVEDLAESIIGLAFDGLATGLGTGLDARVRLPRRPAASPELGDHDVVAGTAHGHVVHPGAAAEGTLARHRDQLVTERAPTPGS